MAEYYYLQPFAKSRRPVAGISDKMPNVELWCGAWTGEVLAVAVGLLCKLSKRQISFRVTISRPCGGVERRALSALTAMQAISK